MERLNEKIKSSKGKYLIVNRRYYMLILEEVANSNKVETWDVVVEKYKGLIVAVTDVRNFEFDII